MRKNSFFVVVLFLLGSCLTIYAQAAEPVEPSSSGGIDWSQVIFVTGYLLGVFILLPIVIFTNLKEKLFSSNSDEIQIIDNLSQEERNKRAISILEKIESKMTSFIADNGENMVTITTGKQAKFIKQGLDYINKNLAPSDPEIIARVNEFSVVYADRTQRAFTGSYWVIASSIGVAVLLYSTGGISTFLFIHLFGVIFYFLSSRSTMYTIEKRMKIFGGLGGFIGGIMSGLLIGNGTKYYLKYSDGSKKRDWETEGNMAIISLALLVIIAMILGFFAAVLGVVNSLLNYSTSYLLPFKSKEDWFEKNIALN